MLKPLVNPSNKLQASDVQVILMKLPAAGSLLSAAEYIDIDATEPTEQEMSDDEIVQAVLCEAEIGEPQSPYQVFHECRASSPPTD